MHTSLIFLKNPYDFIANLDAVLHRKWIHFNYVYTFTHFIFLIESNFNISFFLMQQLLIQWLLSSSILFLYKMSLKANYCASVFMLLIVP